MSQHNYEQQQNHWVSNFYPTSECCNENNNIEPAHLFTRDIVHTIEHHKYRSIAAPQLESRDIVKNIVRETLLTEDDDENNRRVYAAIDNEVDSYWLDFFDKKNEKLVKNVAAVELLFELTQDYEDLPLLAQTIAIRKAFPKQTNLVETEHIVRLLILHEIKNQQSS